MRIVFLPAAVADLRWLHDYYVRVFPDGHDRAVRQLKSTLQTLRANPHAGRTSEVESGVRELVVPRTPFVILYRVQREKGRIEVLRVIDARSNWRK